MLNQKYGFTNRQSTTSTLKAPTKNASSISAMNSSLNQKMSEVFRKKQGKTDNNMNNTIGGGFKNQSTLGTAQSTSNMNSSIGSGRPATASTPPSNNDL